MMSLLVIGEKTRIWVLKQSTTRSWAEVGIVANRSSTKQERVNHREGRDGPRSSEALER